VQKTLGHKSAVMTLDRYGHLWPDELEDLAERLDRAHTAAVAPSARPTGGPAVVDLTQKARSMTWPCGGGGETRTPLSRDSRLPASGCADGRIWPLSSKNRLSQHHLPRLTATRGFTVGCGPDVAPPWPRGPPSCSCPHSAGPHPMTRAGPMGHEELPLMPEENVTRRRHALLVDVTQAASEVSRLVHEARDLHLPVEPGVRDGRNALVRWAVLLEEVLP
jgi:hypothetical protein